MIIHGTEDAVWNSDGPRAAYDSLPSDLPRAYLEIEGMDHTPSRRDDIDVFLRYATAFFRYYLQRDPAARASLTPAAAPSKVSLRASRLP